MEPAQLMGAPLFKTNGWAQSSPYPVSPLVEGVLVLYVVTMLKFGLVGG